MLSGVFNAPQWAIEKSEADQVASATNTVLSHYKIPGLDQRTQDWMNFALVMGVVYGTRIMATARKPKAEKPIAPEPGRILDPNETIFEPMTIVQPSPKFN